MSTFRPRACVYENNFVSLHPKNVVNRALEAKKNENNTIMSTAQAKYKIITQEELDAHGMTLEEMHERLVKNIKRRFAERERCKTQADETVNESNE